MTDKEEKNQVRHRRKCIENITDSAQERQDNLIRRKHSNQRESEKAKSDHQVNHEHHYPVTG